MRATDRWLDACRRGWAARPRPMPGGFWLSAPTSAAPGDTLRVLDQRKDALYQRGEVRWAYVLMAYDHLWTPGDEPGTCDVLWSDDPFVADDVFWLEQVHDRYWWQRERQPVDGRAPTPGDTPGWCNMGADSDAIPFRHHRVRPLLTRGRVVYRERILVHPEQLPGRRMVRAAVPIVRVPAFDETPARLLPGELWPEELRAVWAGPES